MKDINRHLRLPLVLLAAFVLWTWAVCTVDVRAIGPLGSSVGFAALNEAVHRLTGFHNSLYILTDWLGLVPLGFCAGFGLLGLLQWIQRKSLRRVDSSLLILGGFYLAVLAAYGLFEVRIVNYRPVLIDGALEASYPSSTTMLALCVMPTAAMQLRRRIRREGLRRWTVLLIRVFTVFLAAGRLFSGVHWFSDIIGGALLSAGLVALYSALTRAFAPQLP